MRKHDMVQYNCTVLLTRKHGSALYCQLGDVCHACGMVTTLCSRAAVAFVYSVMCAWR